MHKLAAQRLVVAWIALLGILFAALSPALSHAMTATAAKETVQVCTAQGMVTIAVDKAAPGKPVPDHLSRHCPYCATHGGAPALPPAPAFVFPILPCASSHPPLFYQAAAPQFAWTAAQPRAPPAPA